MIPLTTLPPRQPEAVDSVALIETAKGAELHLRAASGALMRLPLADADHLKGLAALAVMAGALGAMTSSPA
ncbi:hypothetical protein KPL78_08555 [Roseomonas sp. HJA6]|uniref:Uncharacterized protein n=1 Tax=Roseomonas alba TaxID=2846776 RepID=A0ABS7A805_9PROT|nr:hypothetical protein [Neoroseomonas alba]MBW6397892.1 hypothetical protein [Neoroseomonas alba]